MQQMNFAKLVMQGKHCVSARTALYRVLIDAATADVHTSTSSTDSWYGLWSSPKPYIIVDTASGWLP